jgi:CheY-like chemotaxis protein
VCPIHRSQEGGQAALERLEQTVYDPALCDLEMPEVDGVAICRAGVGHPHRREKPVDFERSIRAHLDL